LLQFSNITATGLEVSHQKIIKNKEKSIRKIYSPSGKFAERAKKKIVFGHLAADKDPLQSNSA